MPMVRPYLRVARQLKFKIPSNTNHLPNANGQDGITRGTHGRLGESLVSLNRFHNSWRGIGI
jgi:hypothetical protein